MNIELLREYCLAKKGVSEETPFDDVTLVYKVMGKMFALVSIDGSPLSVNLKCNPDWAIELREQYPAVLPGYHMSKVHWNTILLDGSIPWKLICEWVEHSYTLVVTGLPGKLKKELNNL